MMLGGKHEFTRTVLHSCAVLARVFNSKSPRISDRSACHVFTVERKERALDQFLDHGLISDSCQHEDAVDAFSVAAACAIGLRFRTPPAQAIGPAPQREASAGDDGKRLLVSHSSGNY
jgi:hypothetical protein